MVTTGRDLPQLPLVGNSAGVAQAGGDASAAMLEHLLAFQANGSGHQNMDNLSSGMLSSLLAQSRS
jgi:hypothetical protein